jgi:acetyltransferase-like isoleucine patch superfamily enzyme
MFTNISVSYSTLKTVIKMKLLNIKIGNKFRCSGDMFLRKTSNSKILIGDNFIVNNKTKYNCAGILHKSIIVALDGGIIHIGNNVGISGVTIVAYNEIVIENDVLIGVNTRIYDSDFHPISFEDRKNDPSNIKTKKVVIGEGTFIGANTIILKGSSIGKRCVIGAGAVVAGVFTDDCVIAGNPARVIKKLNLN